MSAECRVLNKDRLVFHSALCTLHSSFIFLGVVMPQTAPKKKKIRVPKVVNGQETMVEIEVDDTGGPTWGPNDGHALLNHRRTRVAGPVKVSGAARYTYDVRLPGMLYGRVLRSPHAHARVKNVDLSAALK